MFIFTVKLQRMSSNIVSKQVCYKIRLYEVMRQVDNRGSWALGDWAFPHLLTRTFTQFYQKLSP